MQSDQNWKNIEAQEDDDLSALLNMSSITKRQSKDPLEKIKRNLIINIICGAVIVCFYLLILIWFPFWPLLLCIGSVLLFTVWAVYSAVMLYQKINKPNPDNNLLQELQRHYDNIRQWMTVNQNAGLLIYPVSGAGGFMLGGFLGSGKPIEVFMQKQVVIISLLVVLAVLVPCCHYLAKWMCKKSFGQYADNLSENIEALKSAT